MIEVFQFCHKNEWIKILVQEIFKCILFAMGTVILLEFHYTYLEHSSLTCDRLHSVQMDQHWFFRWDWLRLMIQSYAEFLNRYVFRKSYPNASQGQTIWTQLTSMLPLSPWDFCWCASILNLFKPKPLCLYHRMFVLNDYSINFDIKIFQNKSTSTIKS